jgi:tetratricopeptide (TPR) repeat protein/predicted aspartyl protease
MDERLNVMRKTSISLCLTVAAILLAAWPAWSDPSASDAGIPQTTQSTTTFSYFTPSADAGGHGTPCVRVELSNHVTAIFIIDTGSSVCMVSDALAAKLGIVPQPWMEDGERMTDVRGKPADYIHLLSLKLGSMPVGDMRFSVVPEDYIHSVFPRVDENSVDGVIGIPIFQQFTALFDFPNHQITLWSPAGVSDLQKRQIGFGDIAPILLSESQSTAAVCGVDVIFSNGKRRSKEFLEFDTGAQDTTVLPSLVHQLGLVAGPVSWNTTSLGTVGTRKAQVDSLSVGQIRVTNQTLTFPSEDDGRLPVSLGMDVLSQYRVLFDLQHQRMYVMPGLASMPTVVGLLPVSKLDFVKLRSLVSPPSVSVTVSIRTFPPSRLSTVIDNRPLTVRRLDLQRHLQQHPSDAFGWQLLAETENQMGHDTDGVTASTRAVSLYRIQVRQHPKNGLLLAHLGDALRDAGRKEEAEGILRKSVTLAPANWLGWAALGELHSDKAYQLLIDQKTASVSTTDITQFQQILTRLQKNPPAPSRLALAARLAKQGEDESGRAVALAPINPLPYIYRNGNFSSRYVQNLLQALHGQYSDPLTTMMNSEMSADAHTVARLEPESIAAIAGSLLLDFDSGTSGVSGTPSVQTTAVNNDVQAQEDRLKRLTRSGDPLASASAFSLLGFIQMMWLHDMPAAEMNFRKAIALDVTQETAWQGLTLILAQQERYGNLSDLLRSYLHNPDDPDAVLDHLFLARSEYKQAVANKMEPVPDMEIQARLAMQLAPHDLVARLTLAALLLKESDHRPADISEAGKLLPPLPPTGTPPDLSTQYALTRGLYLALAGQSAQAVPTIRAVLQADPDNADAKNILAALQPAPVSAP